MARLMRLAEPALDPRLPGVVALGLLSGTRTPLPGLAGVLLARLVAADCLLGGGETSAPTASCPLGPEPITAPTNRSWLGGVEGDCTSATTG